MSHAELTTNSEAALAGESALDATIGCIYVHCICMCVYIVMWPCSDIVTLIVIRLSHVDFKNPSLCAASGV